MRASTLERYAAAIGSQISWRLQDPGAGRRARAGRQAGLPMKAARQADSMPVRPPRGPGPPGRPGRTAGAPRRPPARPGHRRAAARLACPGTAEPPAYPVVPPSRVWTDQGDWPGQVYQRLLEQRIVLASGLLDGPAASVLSAQLLTLDAEGDGPVRLELQGLDAELPAALTIMGVLDVLRVPVTGTWRARSAARPWACSPPAGSGAATPARCWGSASRG